MTTVRRLLRWKTVSLNFVCCTLCLVVTKDSSTSTFSSLCVSLQKCSVGVSISQSSSLGHTMEYQSLPL